MSQARKQLKIISFIQVIVMVWAVVQGVLFVTSAPEGTNPLGLEPQAFGILLGVLLVVAGALTFLAAAQGIRGANVPSKLGPHAAINTGGTVVALVGAALAIMSEAPLNSYAYCLVLVVDVVSLVWGNKVRKEQDR